MTDEPKYRVRLRFRVGKKLALPTPKHSITVAGRAVVLSGLPDETPIEDSDWLVLNAHGIDSEGQAAEFGSKLKAALEVSSAAARIGVDTGVNRATFAFGQMVKDAYREKGLLVRDNIHGVDVFPDEPNVRVVHGSITGTLRAQPDPFLADLDNYFDRADTVSSDVKDVLLLLNRALMRTDPLAQVVFALSAVEMLGQREWSAAQQLLITALAEHATHSTLATGPECAEVADAVRRGLHRLSLRQGVLRLLRELGLDELKREWDELYKARSTLFHGLAPDREADYGTLGFRAITLCGRILGDAPTDVENVA